MPLVQFAMAELWRKRDHHTRRITRASLEAIGGIAGALERHADATLAALERAHHGAYVAGRDVLLALTTPQGTRAVRDERELERVRGGLGREVVAVLEAARLIVREDGGVTLAHEALVTQWGQLRAWVAEARADRILVEEIERDAERFRADETAPLWKKRRLEAAEDVLRRKTVPMSKAAEAFVRAGRRAERRARLFTGGAALGAVALATLVGAFYIRDVDAQKAKAEEARAFAERNFTEAREQKRQLEEAKAKNDELLQKLADAKDKEAMFALQDEVKRARSADKPAARSPAPKASGRVASSPAGPSVARPPASHEPAPSSGPGEPVLVETFED